MTGNASTTARTRAGWLARFGLRQQRYFAVDGGSGAHLLTALAGFDPSLQPVAAPRHADLLIVAGPINPKLVPAINEMTRVLPRPARALLIDTIPSSEIHDADLALGVRRVAPDLHEILAAARASDTAPTLNLIDQPIPETPPIPLPSKRQREMATELAVLSLGPIQAFTAGPLRLLLVFDGEQIVSAQVEAGYAERGIAQRMTQLGWRAAADLAAQLDPLAPVAGRLAFVQAVEQLGGAQVSIDVAQQRAAALAMERAQNHLWWFVRFARLIVHEPLAARAYELATRLAKINAQIPVAAILLRENVPHVDSNAGATLRELTDQIAAFAARVERDRPLTLRTRGLGVLALDRLQAANVSGPVLAASERGRGDVQSRVVARLSAAAADLRQAADTNFVQPGTQPTMRWDVPAGEAQVSVEGPRGRIGLRIMSAGNDRAAQVEWGRPSAALLRIVPDLLVGQKLADAEVIIASLDLAMAEADG